MDYRVSASFINSFIEDKEWNGFVDALLKKYEANQYSEWGCYFEDYLEACYHSVYENNGDVLPLPEYNNARKLFKTYVDAGIANLSPELILKWLAEIGPGAVWQPWQNKKLVVGDDTFTFVGKPDIIVPGRILDLKTSNKNPPRTKFAKSVQHATYIWFNGIERFDYLIHSRENPSEIIKQSYEMSPDVAEDILKENVEAMMAHLKKNPPLLKLFNMNFPLDRPGKGLYDH